MFICYSITYCFSNYVNFYHIFHISVRSSELILYYYIIYYHMFSPMLSCVFIYYTFHIPLSFIYFLYFTCSFPFRVLYFVLSIYCIHVLFIYYFHISIFIYCSFPILFSCYTFHMAFSFMYLHMLSYIFI